jgi:hypothetical protein
MELILSNLLGFVLGTISSFLSWWILFHVLVPKIVFCGFICKSPAADDSSGWRYAFQFANVGRRHLIDAQVSARLSTRTSAKVPWTNTLLVLDWAGATKVEVPLVKNTGWLSYRVHPNQVADFHRSAAYSDEIRQKAAAGTLSLEDLLSGLASEGKATLTATVAGFDALSGARRVFQSQPYTVADIRQGKFEFLTVITETEPDAPSTSVSQ